MREKPLPVMSKSLREREIEEEDRSRRRSVKQFTISFKINLSSSPVTITPHYYHTALSTKAITPRCPCFLQLQTPGFSEPMFFW